MAQQHGFKFTIKGEVFVSQASKAGADVVAAHKEAVGIRDKISAELLDVPASFTITEPEASSRRVPDQVEPASTPDPADAAEPKPKDDEWEGGLDVTKPEEPPEAADPAEPEDEGRPMPPYDPPKRKRPARDGKA